MTRHNAWFVGLLAPVMIAVLGLAGSTTVTAADQSSGVAAEVKIDNFSFGPQTVTVPVGATVTWTNRDDIPHTVVSTEGCSSPKYGTRTKRAPTHLRRRVRIPTCAQFN